MHDLRHLLCKREEQMGWGIMKDALEKESKKQSSLGGLLKALKETRFFCELDLTRD